jgi:hypothetical protein
MMRKTEKDSLHQLVQDALQWGAVAAACALAVGMLVVAGYSYGRWFA